jgi:DNA-binding CsgD family transcriptional regulator
VLALARVERFVDAAEQACTAAIEHGPYCSAVLLHTSDGPPVLMVDNYTEVTDEYRLRTGPSELNWNHNPMLLRIRDSKLPTISDDIDQRMHSLAREHGYTGRDLYHFASPLIGPHGWFATLMAGAEQPCSRQTERALAMLVTELCAWCTAHGIAAVPSLPEDARLTRREYEIARLVTAGLTNVEIAERLAISINTVKVRLKQAFERLGVEAREQLAQIMRRLAPLEHIPIGVSVHNTVKVTRADHTARWLL